MARFVEVQDEEGVSGAAHELVDARNRFSANDVRESSDDAPTARRDRDLLSAYHPSASDHTPSQRNSMLKLSPPRMIVKVMSINQAGHATLRSIPSSTGRRAL